MLSGNSKYISLLANVRKLKAGEAYVLTQGVHFTCQPESMRGVIYELAATKGWEWKGTVSVVGRSVIYCFYKKSDYMRPNLPAYPIVQKYRGEG